MLLSFDVLEHIIKFLPDHCHFAVALTCREFRDIIARIYKLAERNGYTRRMHTDICISCSYGHVYLGWIVAEHAFNVQFMSIIGKYCVRYGDMQSIRHMKRKFNIKYTEVMCLEAIKYGFVDMFDEMEKQTLCNLNNIIKTAARYNQFSLFVRFFINPKLISGDLMDTISAYGTVEMLDFVWFQKGINVEFWFSADLTYSAAQYNNMNTFYWLIAHNVQIHPNVSLYGIYHDNMELFNVGMQRAMLVQNNTLIMAAASKNSVYLRTLLGLGWPASIVHLQQAIDNNRLDNVKLLLNYTFMDFGISFMLVASDEHIELLRFLRKSIDNNNIVKHAALHGDNILVLREFPITQQTVRHVGNTCALLGRINMLKYICTHYVIEHPRTWFEYALRYGQYMVIRYLHKAFNIKIELGDFDYLRMKPTLNITQSKMARPLYIKSNEYLLEHTNYIFE